MLTEKDAKGQTLCFKYDLLGPPSKKAQPGGADGCDINIQTQWTYDDSAVAYSKALMVVRLCPSFLPVEPPL